MTKKLRLLVAIGMTLGSLASVQAQSFLTNGLLAHYPFNGNANDSAGTNHGVVVGAALSGDRFGDPSSAYLFNGTNSYIQLPLSTPTNTFSLSAWVKLQAVGRVRSILGNDDELFAGKSLQLDTNGVPWLACINPVTRVTKLISASRGITTNVWQHVACSVNQGQATFYVNGVMAFGGIGVEQWGINWRIGVKGSNVTQSPFLGGIDDVRIYNRPLGSNEMAMLYYYESNPKVNLVKMYTLDFDSLTVGTNYQLQVSTNLLSWTNWGSTFTATSVRYTNAVPIQRVDDWGKIFFRLTPQ